MEAREIFPVFSELHSDEVQPVTAKPPKPARKRQANEANLFLVTPENASDSQEDLEPLEDAPLRLTGDLAIDTVTLLRSLAFVLEFFNSAEPGDLRQAADRIRDAQVRR